MFLWISVSNSVSAKQICQFSLWLSTLIVLNLQWSEFLPLLMSVSLSMDHLQLIKESRYKKIWLILSFPGISLQTENMFLFLTLNESGLSFWNFERPCNYKGKVPERGCFLISLYQSYWSGPGCSFSSTQSDQSDHLSIHHTCILSDSLWLKIEGECFFKMSPKQPS
jgi:hypothetical protein